MKLKTLKDLEKERATPLINFEDLKQEAIKEIKAFENRPSGTAEIDLDLGNGEILTLDWGVIRYIKWKNNITEEDLK